MSNLEACRHHIDVDFSYTYIHTDNNGCVFEIFPKEYSSITQATAVLLICLSLRCTMCTFFGWTDGLIMPDRSYYLANKKQNL